MSGIIKTMKIAIVTDAKDNRGNPTNGVKVGWALKRLGHEVTRQRSGADLVLVFGTAIRAEANSPGYIQRIRESINSEDPLDRPTFALWYFDLCNPDMKHDLWKFPTMRRVVTLFDWIITTDHSYPWEKLATNYLHLMQGVEPKDFAGSIRPPEPRRHDVIFTGGFNRPFHDRRGLINTLKRHFSVVTYGRGSASRVYGRAFFSAYQQARVGLVPPPPKEAPHDYWSNRIYLATATGTPCVVGYAEGLEKHYEDGKEVMFFRNKRELIEAVGALVNDPDLRQKIGQAGRQRTLADHTYDKRCEVLLERIFND